jgi:predicted phosphodiesterase
MKTFKCLQRAILALLVLLAASCTQHKTVRFGICADVHKDVMHDADQRLQVFVREMNESDVDFIIELGDFMQPQDYNASFLNEWKSFKGPSFHVLGNHDMDNDKGDRFSRDHTVSHLDMPARHYSFDVKGLHFVVLDGNDQKDPPQSGYARYMGKKQLEWLEQDLALTKLPVIVFSHQSLEDPGGIENEAEVRKILEAAKLKSGDQKVIACFSGHHHIDYSTSIKGINYVQINSMSYYWMGSDYLLVRYSKEIDEQYPYIKYTAPYRDPIYAMVEVDPRGIIRITGKESSWVGPTPWELGYPEDERNRTGPRITNRELKY